MGLSTHVKLTLARAAQRPIVGLRQALGRPAETVVERRGLRWRLDLAEGIDFAIYLFGQFEPRTARCLAAQVRAGSVALDVGANIGAHTLPLARAIGPRGRVYAFEPTAFAFGKLSASLALNPDLASRVRAEQLMLRADDSAPPAALYSSWPLEPADRQHESHGGRAMSTEGAGATSLDAYVEDRALDRVDLIKIDVDGFELEVLSGARRTLDRFGPALVFEVAPTVLAEHGVSLETLVALLRDHGYRLRDEAGRREMPMDATALAARAPPRRQPQRVGHAPVMTRRAVLLVLAAALAVRTAYALAMWVIAGPEGLMAPDSRGYALAAEEFAAQVAAGQVAGWDWLGGMLDRMPLPAWQMALCELLFGGQHILAYVLVQGLFDAITCAVVAATAGCLRPGLYRPAAVIAVLNPTMVVVSGLYLTDTLFVMFCALAFHAALRWLQGGRWSWALAVGLFLGLAVMSRSLAFLFVPVMAGTMVVVALRRRPLRALAQGLAVVAVAAVCVSPVLLRNIIRYESPAITPQTGIYLLFWQVGLARERVDGTPFAETAREMQDRFAAAYPDYLTDNPFTVSERMSAMALDELSRLGLGAVARAWAFGAALNLAAPAATIVPPVAALPRTGFYATEADGLGAKVYAFLFENQSPAYAWIVVLGGLGVVLIRLVQLRGLWVWARTPGPARPMLLIAVLWVGYILAVNGPVASPKYRLPIEPLLVVALAFGLARGPSAPRAPTPEGRA